MFNGILFSWAIKDESLNTYNFIVINTVDPGKIYKLVKEAEHSRKIDYEKDNFGEFIEIDNDLYKLLKLTPVYNSKITPIKAFCLFNLFRNKRKVTSDDQEKDFKEKSTLEEEQERKS